MKNPTVSSAHPISLKGPSQMSITCEYVCLPFSLFRSSILSFSFILSLFFSVLLCFSVSQRYNKKKKKHCERELTGNKFYHADHFLLSPPPFSLTLIIISLFSLSLLLSFVYVTLRVSSSVRSRPQRKLGAGPKHEVQRRRVGPVHRGRSSEARMHHRCQHRSRKTHRCGESRMHSGTRW